MTTIVWSLWPPRRPRLVPVTPRRCKKDETSASDALYIYIYIFGTFMHKYVLGKMLKNTYYSIAFTFFRVINCISMFSFLFNDGPILWTVRTAWDEFVLWENVAYRFCCYQKKELFSLVIGKNICFHSFICVCVWYFLANPNPIWRS